MPATTATSSGFAAIEDHELARITAPSLIAQGAAGRDVEPDPQPACAMTARVPNAELLELDAGTHFAFYAHPDADRARPARSSTSKSGSRSTLASFGEVSAPSGSDSNR